MKNKIIGFLFGVIITVLLYFTNLMISEYRNIENNENNAKNKILIIDKSTQKLTVYDAFYGVVTTVDVSTGENPGNKTIKGDLKTPEGIFPVIGIEDASDWSYDFKDGNGQILGAYGPYFIRLKTDEQSIFNNVNKSFNYTSGNEFTGIGIHGTHLNDLIGKRASHGCIRLKNEDLLIIKLYIVPGTLVAIIPGVMDFEENLKSINTY